MAWLVMNQHSVSPACERKVTLLQFVIVIAEIVLIALKSTPCVSFLDECLVPTWSLGTL